MPKLDWTKLMQVYGNHLSSNTLRNQRSKFSRIEINKEQAREFHGNCYGIVLALLLGSSGADVLTASLTPYQRVASSISTLDATDLLELAQRRPRSGLGGRDGGVCAVSPGLLEDENTVWSDRPLFLWQIKTEGITLQRLSVIDQEGRILWEKQLAATDQGVVYEGAALEPGQFYQWQLEWTVEDTEQFADYTFQVMPSDRRNQITTKLQALSQQLQASGASAETIAQQQADYLTEQEPPLWSDALKLLYTVENPSLDTTQRIQDWLSNVCGNEENT